MISLRQVRYFLAVAETEKVSAAAANRGISQSAITLANKELENQLGVTLFERRVGGVTLTREGQNFVAHARNIEAAVADAVADMHPDRTDMKGKVRFGVTNAGAGVGTGVGAGVGDAVQWLSGRVYMLQTLAFFITQSSNDACRMQWQSFPPA